MKKVIALSVLLTAACANPDRALDRARSQEAEKQFAAAMLSYEKYLELWPKDAGAPEALFRIARLHHQQRGNCGKAVPLYEASARLGGTWGQRSIRALLSCPDYFPFPPGGKWTYVDTLSGGENMRLELAVARSSGAVNGLITGAFYAGKEKFLDYNRKVIKEDWGIWEEKETGRAPILRFPFQKGRSWTSVEGGKTIRYSIVKDSMVVKVKAGRFTGCLKVKAKTVGFESWVFDYYCPGVGRVKTSVGAPGVENPNTELASYKL